MAGAPAFVDQRVDEVAGARVRAWRRLRTDDVRQPRHLHSRLAAVQAERLAHQLRQLVQIARRIRIDAQRRRFRRALGTGVNARARQVGQRVEAGGFEHAAQHADMGLDGLQRPAAEVGGQADGVDHLPEFALEQRRVVALRHPDLMTLAAQVPHQVAADETPAAEHGEGGLRHCVMPRHRHRHRHPHRHRALATRHRPRTPAVKARP